MDDQLWVRTPARRCSRCCPHSFRFALQRSDFASEQMSKDWEVKQNPQPWPCCPEQRPPGTRRSSSLPARPPRFRPRPVPLRRVPSPLHPEAGPAAPKPNATAAPRRCSRTSAEQHPPCPACAAARRTRRGGEKPTTRKRLPPAWGRLTLLLLPLVPAPTRKREPGACMASSARTSHEGIKQWGEICASLCGRC